MKQLLIVALLMLGGLAEVSSLIDQRNYQVVRGTMAAGIMAAFVQPEATPAPTPPKPPTPGNTKGDKLHFVEFTANWCPQCRRLEKTLADTTVKKELEAFKVFRLNVDDNRELANKYKVLGVPAYFIVKDDGTIVAQGTGYMTPANFLDWLKRR